MKLGFFNKKVSRAFCFMALALTPFVGSTAYAQVLGHHYRPHYWDLPTDFDNSFVFPGQTMYYSSSDKSYNAKGDKVTDPAGKTDTLFGFTIIPYFFKFDKSSDWAYALSLNTYEFRMSTPSGVVANGVGSVIPSFEAWTKPTKDSTIGYDILLSTPFSLSSSLDSKAWDLYVRGFYDLNINNWNIEGIVGYQTTFPESGSKPKDQYHFNGRLGYDFKGVTPAGLRVTPYVSTDYQVNEGNTAHLLNVGGGVLFTNKNFVSVSVGYSKSVKGQNMPETNAVLAQVWFPL